MDLAQFNQEPVTEFLAHCVNIPRWAEAMAAARPFSSKQAVLAFAQQQVQSWTWQEVLNALNTHPKIGEKKAQHALTAQEKVFSEREQATAQSDPDTLAQILAANLSYQKRFGYIFLIKAAGLSSQQILNALNTRLQNDDKTEQQIVQQQLAAIALSRLEQELHHD